MIRRPLISLCWLASAWLLVGCGGTNKGTTVIEAPRPATYEYRVKSGDTLFSIAYRHEMNYVELARVNEIAHPYTIYPDQVLKVTRAEVVPASPPKSRRPATIPSSTVAANEAAATKPNTQRQPATQRPPKPASPALARPSDPAAAGWAWPSKNRMSKTFGPNNKGVDFQLGDGSEVQAAGGGTVVYAGSGIGGYRNLVIIRHDERYLSAYSLDQDVLVKEGQPVRSGEVIARIAGEASKDLHFEVRDRGKPVDPMKVLQAKK